MYKNIVVLGGGTAGWMSAVYIAKKWAHKNIRIQVIESDAIGTIGVGEGTVPSIADFFDALGIPEYEWMPKCNATYKNGIRFKQWSSVDGHEDYFHPFYSELDAFHKQALITSIALRTQGFNTHAHPDVFSLVSKLDQENKSPISSENYLFKSAYAYHFDAGLLADFLKSKAIELGVEHTVATISDVKLDNTGAIASIISNDETEFLGDLFIDCSGFKSMLLGRALGVEYISFNDTLLNDAAVTVATEMDSSIPSATYSTALSSGWAWQIPLTHRYGNGYVYSSKHISPEQATIELLEHLNLPEGTPVNHVKMRVGRFAKGWEKNCAALGLAQGFVEPLEATALHFVTQSVIDLVSAIEDANYSDANRDIYNKKLEARFTSTRDYIELHYLANSRTDSKYWHAARSFTPNRRLQRLINAWQRGENIAHVLNEEKVSLQLFSLEAWVYLLAGKGFYSTTNERTLKVAPDNVNVNIERIKQFVNISATHFKSHKLSLENLKP